MNNKVAEAKNHFFDYEFSIVVLTSVPKVPEVEAKDIPQDPRLHGKDLTSLFREETIPGILNNAKGERFECVWSCCGK